MTELSQKVCRACEGEADKLSDEEIQANLDKVSGWELSSDGAAIAKEIKTKNFKEALAAVNRIGEIAESEGHHPDLNIHGYNNLCITLSTHSLGGLSENDFIMAAKIDKAI